MSILTGQDFDRSHSHGLPLFGDEPIKDTCLHTHATFNFENQIWDPDRTTAMFDLRAKINTNNSAQVNQSHEQHVVHVLDYNRVMEKWKLE